MEKMKNNKVVQKMKRFIESDDFFDDYKKSSKKTIRTRPIEFEENDFVQVETKYANRSGTTFKR